MSLSSLKMDLDYILLGSRKVSNILRDTRFICFELAALSADSAPLLSCSHSGMEMALGSADAPMLPVVLCSKCRIGRVHVWQDNGLAFFGLVQNSLKI